MPQNVQVVVPPETWTLLTDADVTTVTFQNLAEVAINVTATPTSAAPSGAFASYRYGPGQGERNVALAALFPGVASPARLWARSLSGATVAVSHA